MGLPPRASSKAARSAATRSNRRSPSVAASSPDTSVSAARTCMPACPAGASRVCPSPCWIHNRPGTPACSGRLRPRPANS
ncbi:Uncharacterised protein [Bordetella pertussis]|nr:Uncharacterised protein [Bordetella pertussis]